MITVLVSPKELTGSRIEIQGDSYRHLFRARRVEVGAALRLVDGEGRARWGRVAEVRSKAAGVDIGEAAPHRDPAQKLVLLVASPRFQRASWLVEKATELGVAEIHFLSSERAPREYGDGNLDRLRRIARSALEQSHGARLPELSHGETFGDIPELLAQSDLGYFLDTSTQEAGPVAAADLRSIAVAVGPEGGWAPLEQERLASWGMKPWSLGCRVLRVETAAIVAAAWWLARQQPADC